MPANAQNNPNFFNFNLPTSYDSALNSAKEDIGKPVYAKKKVQTDAHETNPPTVTQTNNAPVPNAPTLPGLSRGLVANTTIDQMNNSLAHMCDFSQDIKKSIGLGKYIQMISKAIRDAIRYVKRALGLGDTSGFLSTCIQKLKSIAAEIHNFIKEYITPVQEFIKTVGEYVKWAINTIAWIVSLPARFLALLADCLKKVIKAIGQIFTDAWAAGVAESDAEAAAASTAASGEATAPNPNDPSIQDAVKAGQEAVAAGNQAIAAATATVGQVTAIGLTVTAALGVSSSSVTGASSLSPTQQQLNNTANSSSDLVNQQNAITVSIAALPTQKQLANTSNTVSANATSMPNNSTP